MKIKILNQRHPENNAARIARLSSLAEGGPAWHDMVEDWLPKRAVEPTDVYTERKSLATYINHAGSVLDLLAAMLFAEAPKVEGLPDDEYYHQLLNDCDGTGTPWRRWWRETFTHALTGRRCYAWINLPPRNGIEATSRADEEQAGYLEAYLVRVTPEQVLDWGTDQRGRMQWLIWLDVLDERGDVESPRSVRWRWTYVDGSRVRQWEWTPQGGQSTPDDNDDAVETLAIEHNAGRLPVVPLVLPKPLWLMHRVEDAAVAAMRARNEHSWALHQAANELLVLKRDWDDGKAPELGHGHYLKLDAPDDEASYVSPTGIAFEYLEHDVEHTREDLYRVLQAMALSADSDSQKARLSGESKDQDWKATQILLAAYHDHVTSAMTETAKAIMSIRHDGDSNEVAVSGLDGWQTDDVEAFLAQCALANDARALSPTFRRVAARIQAARVLQDEATAEEKEAIRKEIETAPDPMEMADYGLGGAPMDDDEGDDDDDQE
jgi:hypothetical protein